MSLSQKETAGWTDAPEEVAQAEYLMHVNLPQAVAAQVRKSATHWYLTIGTLFGSQSLRCETPELVLRSIERIKVQLYAQEEALNDGRNEKFQPLDPLPGCEVLDNKSET